MELYYKEHTMEQGTDEWHDVRSLKLTASHGTAIGNAGKGLITYVTEKVVESIVGRKENFVSKDMERGNELEPIARAKYEFEKGVTVLELGFIEVHKHAGFSPDGLIDEDYLDDGPGLCEIKARNDVKHYNLLVGGPVDSGVIWQMNIGMFMTKRKWCDFISYNPNFKGKSLFVKRFYADPIKQSKILIGLNLGITSLEKKLKDPFV
jgi:hypothetical protein